MLVRKSNGRKGRNLLSRPHPALKASAGIYLGMVISYLVIFGAELWRGEHAFQPQTVSGLATIGLIVLFCGWWEERS